MPFAIGQRWLSESENALGLGVIIWGSDNICIRKKKKFGGKNWLEPLFVGLWRF